MDSKAEIFTCKLIRDATKHLDIGNAISESNNLQNILSGLERLIPSFLSQEYEFWKHESLDGIFPLKVLKTDINELYLIGMCVLISDQTMIPVCLKIKTEINSDTINTFICKVGENVNNNLFKFTYSSNEWEKKLYTLNENTVKWYYEIEFRK